MVSTLTWATKIVDRLKQTKRFTEEEAVEVLTEIFFLRDSINTLEMKAKKDLDYHLTKPRLRVVED